METRSGETKSLDCDGRDQIRNRLTLLHPTCACACCVCNKREPLFHTTHPPCCCRSNVALRRQHSALFLSAVSGFGSSNSSKQQPLAVRPSNAHSFHRMRASTNNHERAMARAYSHTLYNISGPKMLLVLGWGRSWVEKKGDAVKHWRALSQASGLIRDATTETFITSNLSPSEAKNSLCWFLLLPVTIMVKDKKKPSPCQLLGSGEPKTH